MMISPEVLRRFALFGGLDPALFKELAMLGEEVDLEAGDWLFQEGENADSLYLVLEGQIDLTIRYGEDDDPQYEDLDQLVTGDFVGFSALVEPYVFTLGASAATDARLVQLDAEGLRQFFAVHGEAGYRVMMQLAKGIGERLNNMRVRFVSLV
ncbi:MAG: cyclic nucleotide-binding domain-containing protein [Anaerolineae bacterium]|nr:cyclic nucleotide-binding domain-containing protein [Anaerolineae bacterium]